MLFSDSHVEQPSPGIVSLSDIPAAQPCYKWWEIPYYWAGLKAYDLVAGTQGLTLSRFTSAGEAQRQFPTLAESRPNRDTLKGAVSCTLSQVTPSKHRGLNGCQAPVSGILHKASYVTRAACALAHCAARC